MSTNDRRADGFWRRLGRCLALAVPLVLVSVVLRKCGVPAPAVVAVVLLIPVAVAFVPRAAARWHPWGSALCFTSGITAVLAFDRAGDLPMSSLVVCGLVGGVAVILLESVTGRIARRSACAQ